MSEPEIPDEAYIAAAIADRGFEVERSPGGMDAEVRFVQPHPGYSSRGGVAVNTARAREFLPKEAEDERDPAEPEPADHPAAPELSAAEPGERAETGRQKLKLAKKKPKKE